MSYSSLIIPPVPSIEAQAAKKLHNRFAIINPVNQQVYIANYNQNWPDDDLKILKYIKPEAYEKHADELPKYFRADRAAKLNLLYADEYQPENFVPYLHDESVHPAYELVQ